MKSIGELLEEKGKLLDELLDEVVKENERDFNKIKDELGGGGVD